MSSSLPPFRVKSSRRLYDLEGVSIIISLLLTVIEIISVLILDPPGVTAHVPISLCLTYIKDEGADHLITLF